MVAQLLQFGETRRGWLGVRIQTVTSDLAANLGLESATGALVASVVSGSPAAAAGIEIGDVILEFDGKPIETMRRLPRVVAETVIDKEVDVLLWRNGEEVHVGVTVGLLEEGEVRAEQPPPEPELPVQDVPEMGLTLSALTDELREKFEIGEEKQGVLVVAVAGGSTAAEKGIAGRRYHCRGRTAIGRCAGRCGGADRRPSERRQEHGTPAAGSPRRFAVRCGASGGRIGGRHQEVYPAESCVNGPPGDPSTHARGDADLARHRRWQSSGESLTVMTTQGAMAGRGIGIALIFRRDVRRRVTAWFSVACFAVGLVHVWQHAAEHDSHDTGHFSQDEGELCQLADCPWFTMAAVGPALPEPAPLRILPGSHVIVSGGAAMWPPVRAPPPASPSLAAFDGALPHLLAARHNRAQLS